LVVAKPQVDPNQELTPAMEKLHMEIHRKQEKILKLENELTNVKKELSAS